NGSELREQYFPGEIEAEQQERAESQGQSQKQGPVVRPVKIRQALSQDKTPAVRKEFADADDEELRDSGKNADGGEENEGENQSARNRVRLGNRKGGDAGDDETVDAPE